MSNIGKGTQRLIPHVFILSLVMIPVLNRYLLFPFPCNLRMGRFVIVVFQHQGHHLNSSLWLCSWRCTYGPIESKMFVVRCRKHSVVVQNKPTWGICIHMKSRRCEIANEQLLCSWTGCNKLGICWWRHGPIISQMLIIRCTNCLLPGPYELTSFDKYVGFRVVDVHNKVSKSFCCDIAY